MSGGFFRGTSADQDTRFSNKQAKLLKTQKFAQGLEHLVDVTKVKMDVMKPWIATRVTELLGFEDEVLINFIFGLLEGKEVNGKEIQISLTGFMEKNTGKFMKELWALLLSAQQNSSGVPQQFLDAKEEETRKKKEEADRIADEIQKKREKESKDMDQERVRKMDDGREKRTENPLELNRASNGHPNEKNDGKGFTRERPRSRSLSKSPRSRSHSVSSDKLDQSPLNRSPATRRRYSPRRSRSPPRRGSSYYRRSRSPLRRRSPSPARRRLQSPRRRSRSPGHRRHRRTPSPGQRRGTPSPTRHRRTPSPVRRRRTPSPVSRRRRTPSPARRRRTPSPVRRRRTPSPVRRRRTPSPVRRRRTPSPVRAPSSLRKRSSSPIHRRPPSPIPRKSGSPLHQKSMSPVLDELPLPSRRVSSPSSRGNKRSPSTSSERSPILVRGRSPVQAARSPMRRKRSKTPSEKSLSLKSSSHSPASCGSLSPHLRRSLHKRSPGASSKGKTRSISPYKNHTKQDRRYREDKSPVQRVKDRVRHGSPSPEKSGNQRLRRDSPGRQEESNDGRQKRSEHSSSLGRHRDSPHKTENKDTSLIAKAVGHMLSDSRNNDQERERGKSTVTGAYPESADRVKSRNIVKDSPTKKRRSEQTGTTRSDDKSLQLSNSAKEDSKRRSRIMEEQAGAPNAVSDGSDDDGHGRKEKRRNKRSKRHNTDSGDESNESDAEDRKEAKRRRRAERKLRKEEKRRRREERRRKREERRAEKHKSKRDDSSSPSDEEAHRRDADPSDSPRAKGREIHPVVEDEMDSREKKLEVELRLKALESFKAKKGSGN